MTLHVVITDNRDADAAATTNDDDAFCFGFFPVQIVSFSSRLKFLILFFIMYPTYPHGNLRTSLAVLIEALCQPSM